MDVCCIRCGADGGEHRIGVDVATGDIHCSNCDETYTAGDVREAWAAWQKLLAWIDAYPKAEVTA